MFPFNHWSFRACLLIAAAALLTACGTPARELIDFDKATSMSTQDAVKVIASIAGEEWAQDPYVYPQQICRDFMGVNGSSRIKTSWDEMTFAYLQPPLETAQFRINNNRPSCDKGRGVIVFRQMSLEHAKRFATALQAMGARPHWE